MKHMILMITVLMSIHLTAGEASGKHPSQPEPGHWETLRPGLMKKVNANGSVIHYGVGHDAILELLPLVEEIGDRLEAHYAQYPSDLVLAKIESHADLVEDIYGALSRPNRAKLSAPEPGPETCSTTFGYTVEASPMHTEASAWWNDPCGSTAKVWAAGMIEVDGQVVCELGDESPKGSDVSAYEVCSAPYGNYSSCYSEAAVVGLRTGYGLDGLFIAFDKCYECALPLNVTLNYNVVYNRQASAQVSGGSGSFRYDWSYKSQKSGSMVTLFSQTTGSNELNNSVTILESPMCTNGTLQVTVTDLITGQTAAGSVVLPCSEPYLK